MRFSFQISRLNHQSPWLITQWEHTGHSIFATGTAAETSETNEQNATAAFHCFELRNNARSSAGAQSKKKNL